MRELLLEQLLENVLRDLLASNISNTMRCILSVRCGQVQHKLSSSQSPGGWNGVAGLSRWWIYGGSMGINSG